MQLYLSLIVAMTQERIIGNKGELPWKRLPSDLKHFKKITQDAGTVIMGRATFDSILDRNGKPLPDRKHIVLSKHHTPSCYGSVRYVRTIQDVYEEVAAYSERACIIGGGEIYKLFLSSPYLLKMYITMVHANVPGDVSFPPMGTGIGTEWACTKMSPVQRWDLNDEYDTSFGEYDRQ